MIARVECYSGPAYADRPIALMWEGVRLEIGAILSSWRTPSGKVFLVRTTDEQAFQLAYDESADQWSISPARDQDGEFQRSHGI